MCIAPYHAIQRIGATRTSAIFLPTTALAGVVAAIILLNETLRARTPSASSSLQSARRSSAGHADRSTNVRAHSDNIHTR